MQNVRGEGGAIKYSDFRDLVIHLRIERKWWQNGDLDDIDVDDDIDDGGFIDMAKGHSWKKCFCLQEPGFWGRIFLILRKNFPNMKLDFPNIEEKFP